MESLSPRGSGRHARTRFGSPRQPSRAHGRAPSVSITNSCNVDAAVPITHSRASPHSRSPSRSRHDRALLNVVCPLLGRSVPGCCRARESADRVPQGTQGRRPTAAPVGRPCPTFPPRGSPVVESRQIPREAAVGVPKRFPLGAVGVGDSSGLLHEEDRALAGERDFVARRPEPRAGPRRVHPV